MRGIIEILSLSLLLLLGTADAKIKRVKAGKVYKDHEEVHVVVNKVGPFNNPMETYRYYSLPFCKKHSTEAEESQVAEEESQAISRRTEAEKREGALRHKQRLGESIVGDRRESSPYEISFEDSVESHVLPILGPRHLVFADPEWFNRDLELGAFVVAAIGF